MVKETLLGKTLEQLKEVALANGMPAFTSKQMADWLYVKKVTDIQQMTNLSVTKRDALSLKYEIGRKEPAEVSVSQDGTKKYLFETSNGNFIESVFIPDDDRATLCVSSQVGCKMNCLFCQTGKQGFSGNLSANEILNQIFSIHESDQLTNLVFMGMGEPFDNTLEVLKALEILTAPWGYAWSPRRITVSTIGLIPGMKQFLEHSQCHLAISLHSPFDKERLELMPAQKAYPIEKVLEVVKQYDFKHQRRISFEYIVFDHLNDSMRHARELVRVLKGIPCRVNLIRFHAIPNVDLKGAGNERMVFLRDYLTENGITTTIRRSRGEDILAACGMLSSSKQSSENEI
ncbi:23S rRNA (adenine(2503)-C(2))-methyltransferase RlmN [Paludibacter sp.]|uniref:23S rRNA (adenine(2503)-C(2))-methyltransferase RlmN n=1 Tax=Paludibacter sp. TaxID=1898105 RepID=UPI001352462B|nr:23S rRNA (adenine(2503)-C(2))-methyltransferase RlmN [Paludibacter sp.]MTK54235.1 23S rRNA (adenine(2503)-C(2))-methyltransferase RlmN [Paludibacter sp.]